MASAFGPDHHQLMKKFSCYRTRHAMGTVTSHTRPWQCHLLRVFGKPLGNVPQEN